MDVLAKKLFFILILFQILAVPAFASEAPCPKKFKALKKTTAQKEKKKPVETENEENASRKQTGKISNFIKKRSTSLRVIVLASILEGINLSYLEDTKEMFNEHIKFPVRNLESKAWLLKSLGGFQAVNDAIANVDAENKLGGTGDIPHKNPEDAEYFLKNYEDRLQQKMEPFKGYTALISEDKKAEKILLESMSQQLMTLESTYLNTKIKLREISAQGAPEVETIALEKILGRTERELANLIALRKINTFLTNPKLEEEIISPQAKERFKDAQEFLSETISPEVYQKALSTQVNEALILIRKLAF